MFLFPSFSFSEKEKEVIGGDAVAKSLSVKRNVTFAGTNALARYTSSVGYADTFPSKGKAERPAFAPNTETFSAVHNISVVCLSRLARSPGGLGGRSRIEPRLFALSLSAGVNRGSLRGGTP